MPLRPLMASDQPVGSIVRPHILSCPPNLSLRQVARLMSEARFSSIVVMEDGKVLGIWTERDALRVDFSDPASFERPVREVMSSPVKTVGRDTTLQQLAILFREDHIRHYLVTEIDGRPLGVVSLTDVVTHQGVEHFLRMREVRSVLRGSMHVLAETDSLNEAARIMREGGVDAVIVGYADGEYGILTERDIVRFVSSDLGNEAVGGLASRPLLTVSEGASLFQVRNLLIERRVRHIGVVDAQGSLVDVASFPDILNGMELMYARELHAALQERDEALNTSQRNLHLAEKVIATALEGIIVTDASGVIISVNPAFTRLTGYSAEEAVGRPPSMLRSGHHDLGFYEAMWSSLRVSGHWQGEIWNRRKNGEVYPELLTITAIHDLDGRLTNYAAIFSDISELKAREKQISDLAYYDPLTGVPNRRLLDDRLRMAIAHARRHGLAIALVFIDLDLFKHINDRYGHEVGDRVLVEAARRMQEAVREGDTVARLGGDEFVLLLDGIETQEMVRGVVERVVASLASPIRLDGGIETQITASAGVSVFPWHAADVDVLMRMADQAMYRAKAGGRNAVQVHGSL